MDRLQVAFLALLVVSISLGAATAADTQSTLRAVDVSSFIKQQLMVSVDSVELREDRLVVTTTIENPTGMDLTVEGTRFRLYNATNERLASGRGEPIDERGSLAAGESVTTTYAIRVSPSQHDTVETAFRGRTVISVNVAVQLRETTIVLHRDVELEGET